MKRFYVECVNHHVGYYSVFDRLTHREAEGDVLDQYASLPLDFHNEFGYYEEANKLAEKMNKNEEFHMSYLSSLTTEDFIQVEDTNE